MGSVTWSAAIRITLKCSVFIYLLLYAPTLLPQESTPPVCTQCHSAIKKLLSKKYVHPAVEMGCDSCHINHRKSKTGEAKKPYLNEPQPGLCLNCHDASDKDLITAHRGQPFEKSQCSRCHNPHASDQPTLLYAHQHGPFAARQCGACHAAPSAGKVALTAKTTSAMCFSCHDELRKRYEAAPYKHTLLVADPDSCADCHDPHASKQPNFLRQPVDKLCESCHPVTDGKKFVHEPVKIDCTICHDAHASSAPNNLRATGNDLCLECHGKNAVKIMQAKKEFTLFDGTVTLPAGTFTQLKWISLSADRTKGHPYPGHPVSAPATADRPAIRCTSCHLPHAANGSPRLYLTEEPTYAKLCLRCHK